MVLQAVPLGNGFIFSPYPLGRVEDIVAFSGYPYCLSVFLQHKLSDADNICVGRLPGPFVLHAGQDQCKSSSVPEG